MPRSLTQQFRQFNREERERKGVPKKSFAKRHIMKQKKSHPVNGGYVGGTYTFTCTPNTCSGVIYTGRLSD